MAKLLYKYGTMGSSKTAQALITKFNYEEKGMKVWLIKPELDDRDGVGVARSRIGLSQQAFVIPGDMNIYDQFAANREGYAAIVADECQFLTEEQIEQLKAITMDFDVTVLCFGLKTDFMTHLFPGSKRLFEIADSIQELKTVCQCGNKATVNARIDADGRIITRGEQIQIGGNESYVSMCYACWCRRRYAQDSNQKPENLIKKD